jgi:hypothetical protein
LTSIYIEGMHSHAHDRLGDFTARRRVLRAAAMAAIVGAIGAVVA